MLLAVLLTMLAATGVAAGADPIRVSSLSEPQSVISPQEVDITIKVYNSGQTDMQDKITLYNPTGAPVESYEGLKAEQSVTYQGKWNGTAEEIAKGKILYYIEYTVQTDEGPDPTVRSVPVTIQTEAAAPQLTATYTVSPASARTGQTVTIAYTLSNTGNIELRDIVVENEGIDKKNVTASALSVGEKVTLEQTFTMGKKELTKNPILKWCVDHLLMIPVDRHNMDMAAVRSCLKVLKEGHVLGIFPEGTRHKKGLMEEMEAGVAMMVLRSGVRMLPAYITAKPALFRTVHVYYGDPISIKDIAKKGINKDTCEEVLVRIREAYAQLAAEHEKNVAGA